MYISEDELIKAKDEILGTLGKEFNLEPVILYNLNTALVGRGFAILFMFDRYMTNAIYLRMEDQNIFRRNVVMEYYFCDFLISTFDDNDRAGSVERGGMYDYCLSDLQIITAGMKNHWRCIFEGSMEWVKQYRRSGRDYYPPEPSKLSEAKILKEIFDKQDAESTH
jgi:hypothetical protein